MGLCISNETESLVCRVECRPYQLERFPRRYIAQEDDPQKITQVYDYNNCLQTENDVDLAAIVFKQKIVQLCICPLQDISGAYGVSDSDEYMGVSQVLGARGLAASPKSLRLWVEVW